MKKEEFKMLPAIEKILMLSAQYDVKNVEETEAKLSLICIIAAAELGDDDQKKFCDETIDKCFPEDVSIVEDVDDAMIIGGLHDALKDE